MYRLISLFFLLTPFFFVSCLDVVEEIELNEAKGGKAIYTINMSQSKIKLRTLMKLDSIEGHKIPKHYEIEHYITATVDELKSKEGITAASYSINKEDFIYTLTIHFQSVKALNSAIQSRYYWKS